MNRNTFFPRLYATLLLAAIGLFAAAQTKQIQGVVKDESGEPMIGVNVLIKGTTNGNITDLDGRFTIADVKNTDVLSVSYIGYVSQEIRIDDRTTFDITLREDSEKLEEVVVVGYGVQKRRDLTGAVTSVKQEDLKNLASANAMQAMQAKIPGLDIQQSSGQAGSSVSINLRGARSLLASNGPLILVDGVAYGSTIDLNPSDIESMEVLKDASSTAIYGTRGANGVIIITTKRGKSGRTQVTFNAFNSWNSPTNVATSMYGDREVQRLIDKADYPTNLTTYQNTGTWGTASATADEVLAGYVLADGTTAQSIYEDKSYTNWGDLLLRNSATQNYEIGVNGGSEHTQFNLSLGAMYDNGLMRNDAMDRYNGKLSVDHRISKLFKAGGSLLFTYKNHDKRNSGVYSQALKMTSITHPYLTDGSINATPNPWYAAHCSPLLDDVEGAYQNNTESTRLFGNAYVEIAPLKGLLYRSVFALDRQDSRTGLYQDYESQARYQSPSTNYISSTSARATGITWTNTANYNTTFGGSKHDLTLLLGHELTQTVTESTEVYGDAGTTHYYTSAFYDLSKITSPKTENIYTKSSLLSFFGRAAYKFNEKYLATVSLRADGSSALAEGHKWGYFPSVSLGWRLSEEKFMERSRKWLTSLKPRLSWGISGNAAINPYQTLATLSSTVYYYLGGNTIAGKIPSSMANPNLTWEKTASYNIGVDFGLFNNRISGSVDYYMNRTYDLLFYKTAPASSVFPTVISNIGKTKGSGIEVQLNTKVIESKNFGWDINWSYSHSSDEITELTGGVNRYIDGTNAKMVGERVNTYYDYEVAGIWGIGEYEQYIADWQARNPGKTAAYPTNYGTPGTTKLNDRNDDGKISSAEGEDDRRIYNADPNHIFGFNHTLTYKDFSLSLQLYARTGGYIAYDMNNQLNYETANWGDIDYWTPDNPEAKFPSPGLTSQLSSLYSAYNTAYLWEKANYVKIKDITLSYHLPKSLTGKLGVSNARVYGSLKNYFTLSGIDNYDPERGGSISFPLQKQAVIGINLEF